MASCGSVSAQTTDRGPRGDYTIKTGERAWASGRLVPDRYATECTQCYKLVPELYESLEKVKQLLAEGHALNERLRLENEALRERELQLLLKVQDQHRELRASMDIWDVVSGVASGLLVGVLVGYLVGGGS